MLMQGKPLRPPIQSPFASTKKNPDKTTRVDPRDSFIWMFEYSVGRSSDKNNILFLVICNGWMVLDYGWIVPWMVPSW